MARLSINDIDEKLFWDLATSGIVGDWSLHIVSDYLYMIAEKLKKDTDIYFRVEDYNIVNEELGISIPSTECTSYDKILKIIEKTLSETSKENEYNVNTNKMKNDWGYTFSNTSMSPYFLTNERKWKSYSEFEQPKVFEALYFGVFGEYHKDGEFISDMKKKYLVSDKWNEQGHYRGPIEELKNLEVSFAKNGNISVKTKDEEFWQRINFWYDTLDEKFKNHTR